MYKRLTGTFIIVNNTTYIIYAMCNNNKQKCLAAIPFCSTIYLYIVIPKKMEKFSSLLI